jgi:hypothetical protein
MVVDDEKAFVQSLDGDPKNLTETRDYAVVTTCSPEVDEIIECFEADWTRKREVAGAVLVWPLAC